MAFVSGGVLMVLGLLLAVGPDLYQQALRWIEAHALHSEHVQAASAAKPTQTPLPDGVSASLSCKRLDKSLYVLPESKTNLLKGPVWLGVTAPPGTKGNTVIAAHRDTHFRFLKDLKLGDEFQLRTDKGTYSYKVTQLKVVRPQDRRLLSPLPQRSITLVTCYPFYFVGPAQKRFIVRAVEVGELAQFQHHLPERLVQEKKNESIK